MVEFRGPHALLVIARLVLATLGLFTAVCSYFGFTDPGNVSLLGALALGALGVALVVFAFFAPAKWCAMVFWFCQ
jgi:hypothetical protein